MKKPLLKTDKAETISPPGRLKICVDFLIQHFFSTKSFETDKTKAMSGMSDTIEMKVNADAFNRHRPSVNSLTTRAQNFTTRRQKPQDSRGLSLLNPEINLDEFFYSIKNIKLFSLKSLFYLLL
ncbi:hypothetical protein [Candidatus Kuenenia stuttgartiensis]|uniref:hypothetical protein n=1 Tax=Kuenenia stuttgartiensis TaxID=174633 RepID=UPI00146EE6C8|nr:hypothetical protein [Candidatus Kuenenia stuttgartiensis]